MGLLSRVMLPVAAAGLGAGSLGLAGLGLMNAGPRTAYQDASLDDAMELRRFLQARGYPNIRMDDVPMQKSERRKIRRELTEMNLWSPSQGRIAEDEAIRRLLEENNF